MSLETSTSLDHFHPAVAAWFVRTFGEPTAPQRLAWPAIVDGGHALIAAPTGSGKTLAAFLAAIDGLVRRALSEGLPDAVSVVYVSPLKALSNDIQKNLEAPLAGISAELVRQGSPSVEIRALLRTGDTPSAARAAMLRRPPHILVTTPESLYVLLTSDGGRRLLAPTRTVIVDEIHAVAGDKRGSHLALSLERLEDLVRRNGGELTRIGLSATQKPIEEVARLLVGRDDDGDPRPCSIVDVGHARNLDLAIEIPRSPLGAITPNEVSSEAYDRLAELITQHQTTLVFANTRRQAERVARHLEERLAERPCPNGHHEIKISAHHGSLSRERRLVIEDRLKRGELRALVATSSLELGIDIGSIDLVCQLGSTRTIATLLQRAGRAGHSVGGLPKARLFPLTLGELGECAALLESIRRGELDRLRIPEAPLDILAQQIVAEVAAGERQEDDLFRVFRRAEPFARLPRETFDRLLDDLATGYTTSGGRRGAHLHRDLVQRVLRPRRGARLAAMTSGGAIPDNAEFQVVLEPQGAVVGSVHEDFAAESLAGDVFLLGSSAWRIQKIEQGRVLVEDARGQAPGLPFWFGEAPARSPELSMSLCRLREIAIEEFRAGAASGTDDSETNEARVIARWRAETGIEEEAARQLEAQYAEGYAELGTLPTRTVLVAERFFDEAGDQHLVLHAPFGSRINRAWGLALRKRFCRTFNFELQAAADEDSVVLSLGPTHSFPLADVFRFLSSGTVRAVLVQALLDAPMFGIRWRWNAARSLAIPRFRGGKRTLPFFQRQLAEDLAAVLFPDQLACLENIAGDREIPDHPLVTQTIHDCLTESMDIDGLEAVLGAIERGEIECIARDLPTPSVFAEAILHARPYAFLDDAPLEERRTQSVRRRRRLPRDPSLAKEMSEAGQLDPEAIARVEDEAWPVVESADELADALGLSGFVTDHEGLASGWGGYFGELARAGRAARVLAPPGEDVWIAIERAAEHRALVPERPLAPPLQALQASPSTSHLTKTWTEGSACVEVLRSRLTISGPRTARELGEPLGLSIAATTAALAVLEAQGVVFRGHFRHLEPSELEWCDRRLLARIHRQTLERLRREIEPVAPADFARFLFEWQRVTQTSRGRGPEALAATLSMLEGFTAAAAAWEEAILPARLADYEPEALDAVCFGGRLIWCRANPPSRTNNASLGRGGPVRATPIALLPRESAAFWLANAEGESPSPPALLEDSEAEAVRAALVRRGASFASDLAAATGLLPNRVERALGVLVAAGLATADGFAGLRALIGPSALLDARVRAKVVAQRRRAASAMSATSGLGVSRVGVPSAIERGGRWSLLEPRTSLDLATNDVRVEHITRRLLARYGVVFRRVIEREELLPPWREILTVLRRLEARGEIRGGRFVDGFSGEQYALPEAVAALRNVRKAPKTGELIVISAADPLNLIHLLAPNESAPAALHCRILFRDGVPLAVREGKEIRFLVAMDPAERWLAETTLRRLGASIAINAASRVAS